MTRQRYLVLLLGLFLSVRVSAQAPAPGSLVVIANKAVPVDKIDAGQATQIFLKQINTWPDGGPIQPIDIKEGSPLRAEFYSRISGRSPGQLRAYWARQAFTGMGFPPREVATAEDVSKAVQATPGGIGYIDRKNSDSGTKVVLDPAK
ncbi:MAG: phosphate ABC transporter substrate-binding protein [Leptothrix sp. (in: b-proteobacteria)]